MNREADEFWEGRCPDCAHDDHSLRSCHEITGAIGGDPSNGPDYCPCTIDYANGAMEGEIARLRKALEQARLELIQDVDIDAVIVLIDRTLRTPVSDDTKGAG